MIVLVFTATINDIVSEGALAVKIKCPSPAHTELHLSNLLSNIIRMNLNPAHWHLLLNHLPVVGSLFITLLLAYGLARKSAAVITASYWFFILLAVLTIITSQTGGKAAGYLTHVGLASDEMIGKHAEASDMAQWSVIAVALLSAATLFVRRLQTVKWMPFFIFILSLVSVALMSWTSLLGGEIMHKEIREGFTAPADSSGKENR